jgi:hypothetical protein
VAAAVSAVIAWVAAWAVKTSPMPITPPATATRSAYAPTVNRSTTAPAVNRSTTAGPP